MTDKTTTRPGSIGNAAKVSVVAEAGGKLRVRICAGTACVFSGSMAVHDAFVARSRPRASATPSRSRSSAATGFARSLRSPSPPTTPSTASSGQTTSSASSTSTSRAACRSRTGSTPSPKSGVRIRDWHDIPFYKEQTRIALRDVGVIHPERIDEYIARGGYEAARTVLHEKTREWVIEEVTASGIRGRGGAGFPTGVKWKFAHASPGDVKYFICNGDEGDPGAFMDASIMDGDPHAVIEGMIIGGYAIGAREGYIYVRAEYPLAVGRLKLRDRRRRRARLPRREASSGADWSFNLHIKEGAGAFVCGEETALIGSIEGQRGMPRTRPPFPAVSGLWGSPTNINNVETLSNIP